MNETIHEMLTNRETLVLVLLFVGGTVIIVTRSIIRHRERMSMIENGLDPDAPREEEDKKDDQRNTS